MLGTAVNWWWWSRHSLCCITVIGTVESFTTWHRDPLTTKINTFDRTATLTFNYIADKEI
jgi:hypothetical protein